MFEIIKMSKAKKEGATKAYFTAKYEGLVINNCSLYENKEGELAVSMPSQKGMDNKYYSVVYFGKEDASKMDALRNLAVEHYNNMG